jgi:hypothetical protein
MEINHYINPLNSIKHHLNSINHLKINLKLLLTSNIIGVNLWAESMF